MVKNSLSLTNYPALLRCNPDKTYTIFLRNWPGAISEAQTMEEAQDVAKKLLVDVIDSLFDQGLNIPPAVPAEQGDFLIKLPLDASIKILLRNCMVEAKCSKADLARGLNVPPQRIKGFLSLLKSTNLEFLTRAFDFLGKTVKVEII